jgi:hypothetical protein
MPGLPFTGGDSFPLTQRRFYAGARLAGRRWAWEKRLKKEDNVLWHKNCLKKEDNDADDAEN